MSDLDLEPIKARLDKAHTEWGPWKAKEDSWDGYSVVIDDNGPGVSIIAEQTMNLLTTKIHFVIILL